MRSIVPAPILFVLLALLCGSAFAASGVRTFYRTGPGGMEQVAETGTIEEASIDSNTRTGTSREGMETIWQRHLTDAIYTTTSLGAPAGILAAATYLNPPKEIGVYAIEGSGTPDWTYPGTELYVATSRDGSVIAGVDYDQFAQRVTVGRWEPGSATPLWTTEISSASRGSRQTVVVSGDGSTIAVLVSMQPSTAARLYLFDPASSVPIGVFDGPAGFGRNLCIGEDGRFTAFIGLATAYVVDRDAGAIRWSGSMGASSDPIAISTDGRYLVFGWTSLRALEWNGSAYTTLWTVSGGTHALGVCAFSVDGNRLVAAWYKSTFDQNRVQLYAMPVSTPVWTYDYPLGGGAYQDVPYDVILTPGAEMILVASWGDQLGINDELHLFADDQPTPIATFDTPGSVFDADLAPDGFGGLYVTSCGKAIHANQNGRGGDLYALRYSDPTGVKEPRSGESALRFGAVPNPYRPGDLLRFALSDARLVRVDLFDPAGRRVRRLVDGDLAAGAHLLRWNGLDDAGLPVAAGAYLMVLQDRADRSTARLVLIR